MSLLLFLLSYKMRDQLYTVTLYGNCAAISVPVNRLCKNSLGGWVTKTSTASRSVIKPSTVTYLPPILNPITEYATVKRLIDQPVKLTSAVKQNITIITFGLAAAKKSMGCHFSHVNQYDTVLIRLEVLHIICAYFAALCKAMDGSGFVHILIKSKCVLVVRSKSVEI